MQSLMTLRNTENFQKENWVVVVRQSYTQNMFLALLNFSVID